MANFGKFYETTHIVMRYRRVGFTSMLIEKAVQTPFDQALLQSR